MTDADATAEAQSEFDEALSMLRYAEDANGNRGLIYGYCKEHEWRGRKRDVNNRYSDGRTIRALAIADARAHLQKKHTSTAPAAD